MSTISRLLDAYRRRFLVGDLALSLLVIAIVASLLAAVSRYPLDDTAVDGRRSLYGTGAAIAGSLLGFVIVAVTITLTLPNSAGLRLLRSSPFYPHIFDAYLSAVRYLALATIAFLCLLVLDSGRQPNAIYGYLVLWLALICSFRVGRCVWILRELLDLATGRSAD